MKSIKLISKIILAAALAVAAAACGQRKASQEASPEPAPQPSTADLCLAAVDKYLAQEIGSFYPEAQYCITYSNYADVNDSNPEDIQILGDFWVEKYNLQEDTLMFVAGGNHPGKMHLAKDSQGNYQVTSFDAVGDGSNFIPSVNKIFGIKSKDFMDVHGDSPQKKEIRRKAILKYALSNGISARYYKDYGWAAQHIH